MKLVISGLFLLLNIFTFGQKREIYFTSSSSQSADWVYFCSSSCTAADWIYYTSTPSSADLTIFVTENCNYSHIRLKKTYDQSADWIYIYGSSCTAGDWIYICKSSSPAAKWVYITDNPNNADLILCMDVDDMFGDIEQDVREEWYYKYISAAIYKYLFKKIKTTINK